MPFLLQLALSRAKTLRVVSVKSYVVLLSWRGDFGQRLVAAEYSRALGKEHHGSDHICPLVTRNRDLKHRWSSIKEATCGVL